LKQDKITVRQFKDKSSNWFVNYAHYSLQKDGTILWCSGESDKEELRDTLKNYIKKNKKAFKERSESVFNTVEKEYNEKIPVGKYTNRTVSSVFYEDKKYLHWMIKNYNFTGKERLKTEITDILKS
jgi:hypothetical protein